MLISFHYSTLNELTGVKVWVFWSVCCFGCKCAVLKGSAGVLFHFILHLQLIFANAAVLWGVLFFVSEQNNRCSERTAICQS